MGKSADMTNYESMVKRINQAETEKDFRKLHESLDRLYNAGVFSGFDYGSLGIKILDSQIAKGY